MRTVELTGLERFESLRVVETEKPKPGWDLVLIATGGVGLHLVQAADLMGVKQVICSGQSGLKTVAC